MRVKRNSFGGYKVQAIEDHVAIMHDKALDLGYSSKESPPNWITNNKTPNWDLVFTPPRWLATDTMNKVFKQTLVEQLTMDPQLKAAYDGKAVIVTGFGPAVDEHETMIYRYIVLEIKYYPTQGLKFDATRFSGLVGMLYSVAKRPMGPFHYHLRYNMDLVSPWAVT